MKQLTEADFESHTAAGTVLVDFHAPWCAPCRQMEPILDAFAGEATGVEVHKVDVDAEPGIAERYGVRGLPTLVLFKDGQPVDMRTGFQAIHQIRGFVAAHA